MTTALEGFNPVVALMGRIIASGNDHPKVRLSFADKPLALTVAGARSRNPGAVNLTDGKGYADSTFYGRITVAGEFQPAAAAKALPAAAKAELWTMLQRMKAGEAEAVFAEFGHAFGQCCICGRELTNAESVAIGIGPICRERAFG